jgi:hypothetical protein
MMITKRQQHKNEFLKLTNPELLQQLEANSLKGVLSTFPLETIKHVLSFHVLRLNRYMKRIFNQQNKSELRHVESQIYGLLFGAYTPQITSTEKTPREIFCMWKHVDLSLKSCYQLDQEEDLNNEQLLLLCSALHNFSSINFQGHVHLNDYCVSVLMRNNTRVQFLDLQATQVDYEGIKSILLVKDGKKQKHTHYLKTLKLSRLSRAPLTDANVSIFKYCTSLKHLELSNNGLHQNEVKKLICYQPNEDVQDDSIIREPLSQTLSFKHFTYLNLTCNSITDEGAKSLSICASLKVLVLEDCQLGNEGVKHLLEVNITDMPFHQLSNLTELNVSHNRSISDEGIDLIAGHSTLKKLVLSDTIVGDAGATFISQNKTLQDVELDHTKLGNTGITRILLGYDTAPAKDSAESKSVEIRSNVMNTLVRLNIKSTQVTREEVTRIHQLIRQYQQQQLEITGKNAYSQFKFLLL